MRLGMVYEGNYTETCMQSDWTMHSHKTAELAKSQYYI